MKYVRTKDGRIVDIEKFINEEKDTPYYKDFIFEEINKDGVLKWTAVGTEQNSIEEQRGIRCQFSATLTSEIINQANTIEELCDGFVVISEEYVEPHYVKELIDTNALDFENHWRPYGNGKVLNKFCQELIDAVIYGAIWTEWGLKYVAKMNEKGELELL